MSTEEDLKKEIAKVPPPGDAEALDRAKNEERDERRATSEGAAQEPEQQPDADDGGVNVPTQLGTSRFVYAAYFAGGIAVAFLLSKVVSMVWTRISLWKPQYGEPRDEIVMPVAGIIGALVAVYYYRDQKTRTLVDEVASELSKVTWPSRQDVVNSTFVVIVTTLLATTFFALMDRFWGFVTNLVYGA
jgi:preprotein translocase subunit SecE